MRRGRQGSRWCRFAWRSALRKLFILALTLGVLAAALWLPFQLSPRPGVWVVRSLGRLMAEENEQQREALERRVPAAMDRRLDLTYDPRDPDGRFDLFRPIEFEGELPTVIWVHGGAFIGGTKDDLRPYLALLASRGFIAIGIEYTTAMEAHYPTPVLQLGSALHHLRGRAAADYGIDPERIVLAGDSAGAHIAAQAALAIVDADYAAATRLSRPLPAEDLRAVMLFCGPYDLELVKPGGRSGWFERVVMWAYLGSRRFLNSPAFEAVSIPQQVGPGFPPALVSAGNGDPLLPHSESLVQALRRAGSAVEPLFFPTAEPPLPHEYQFDLEREEGRAAFEVVVDFLERHTAVEKSPRVPYLDVE